MMTKLKPAIIPTAAGGGSGGGADDGNDQHSVAGIYTVTATSVEIVSRTPTQTLPVKDKDARNVITLLATGETPAGVGPGGYVEVRGNTGVRITAGPPPLPATSSDDTNGVEVIVGEEQTITLQRGILPFSKEVITMARSGITIDAGQASVMIQSLRSIKLSVPGLTPGVPSSITLDGEGITIEGLVVSIKGGLFVNVKGATVNIN